MQFDASTIFVLALTIGIVVLLTWAELNSRRHQKSDTTRAGAAAAPQSAPAKSQNPIR
jgi:hypothetical protein